MCQFKELEKVLRKEIPSRPVLFEFYLNDRLHKKALGNKFKTSTHLETVNSMINSFAYYGYDYATVRGSEYWFHTKDEHKMVTASVSLNASATIVDRESFDSYKFMDAKSCDYSALKDCSLNENQKLIIQGPGGVLENVINLVGFDNLCLMIYDDEQLVYDIFEKVGAGLVEYYAMCGKYKSVGALISNDDWGFNTQTMLSPNDMRRFVFPWHKKIVEQIHSDDKYAILHSCGNYSMVLDDLYKLNYDARHSYEDKIESVEVAYDRFLGKLAVLGGIDMNYLIVSKIEDIKERARKLVAKSLKQGGYALGSGNSIPEYVPDENYLAMIGVTKEFL